MKARTILWPGIAMLFSCLALPAMAAQGVDPGESGKKTHHGDSTRPNADDRWKKLDQDNDGKISRSEWKRNEQSFDRIDEDKDGFLTRDELRSAAKEFRRNHRSRLQEMDSDSDGNISRSEWRGKEEIFNRLDADNDGVLSRDELRGGAGERHRPGSHRKDQSDKTTL